MDARVNAVSSNDSRVMAAAARVTARAAAGATLPLEEGQAGTLDYRLFLVDHSGKKVSPWHDIPLNLGDGISNFVVDIPKETSAKMEVATNEPFNATKQDTKKVQLRSYPYNINWNYGLLLQTWEDPSFANTEVEGALGDNDPDFRPLTLETTSMPLSQSSLKPANKFGLGNKAANKDYALKVINETNQSWEKLTKGSIPAGGLSLV
ncbi:inorganic pyrophosphatase, putative [Ricinus communis]|uniref:inorganic diphosphatase n=1 Tax=Ricinus communis TaxID=3988 RepID=B9R6Q9_RICCO|nr:inorganic pyrophosphatase, putative [Ricinus communis]